MREITRSVKVALKCLTAVVLVDVDLPYWTSTVEHIVAFTAIFSNICTVHAQKRLFMNSLCKFRHCRSRFRHRRSIRRPRYPVRVQMSGLTMRTWADAESYLRIWVMNSRWVFSSSSAAHFCSLCCSLCCVDASSSLSHEFSWHNLRTCAFSFCFSDSRYSMCPENATITCDTNLLCPLLHQSLYFNFLVRSVHSTGGLVFYLSYFFVYLFYLYSRCAFSELTLLVGRQEEYPACKNWVIRCWCGYLSVVRCRFFAYGPADATASQTPSSLASQKSRLVLPFWYRLCHVVLEKRPLNGCSSSSSP